MYCTREDAMHYISSSNYFFQESTKNIEQRDWLNK